jgi:hypothetical protein
MPVIAVADMTRRPTREHARRDDRSQSRRRGSFGAREAGARRASRVELRLGRGVAMMDFRLGGNAGLVSRGGELHMDGPDSVSVTKPDKADDPSLSPSEEPATASQTSTVNTRLRAGARSLHMRAHRHRRSLAFDRKISFGDVLTFISVVTAGTALFWQHANDYSLEQKKQANEFRSSAARTLAAFERWRDVSLQIFEQAQPLFVETSERVKSTPDKWPARDYLYKSLRIVHSKVQEKLSDEKVETAYVELFKYHPSMKGFFSKVASDLQDAETIMFRAMLSDTQQNVLTIAEKELSTNSEVLGNALRASADNVRGDYVGHSTRVLQPAVQFLSTLILKSDSDLLKQDNLKAPP